METIIPLLGIWVYILWVDIGYFTHTVIIPQSYDPSNPGEATLNIPSVKIVSECQIVDQSRDHLIFNMGIPYKGKTVFISRRGPGRQSIPDSLSQIHDCWCSGDVRSQGINSHDIEQDYPELSESAYQ